MCVLYAVVSDVAKMSETRKVTFHNVGPLNVFGQAVGTLIHTTILLDCRSYSPRISLNMPFGAKRLTVSFNKDVIQSCTTNRTVCTNTPTFNVSKGMHMHV